MKPIHRSFHHSFRWLAGIILALNFIAPIQPSAQAATRVKQNNTHNLNLATSWDVLPGAHDIVLWNSTVPGANNVLLGADLSWSGIKIANPGGTVNIGAGNALLLGTNGIDMSAATQNLTINSDLTLWGKQSWKVPPNRALYVTGTFSHKGAVVDLTGCASNANMSSLGIDASNIIGPWATLTSGSLLYYVRLTPWLSAGVGGNAMTGTLANVGSATVNYTFSAAATLTGNIIANTLRYSGGNATLANAGKNITLNGLMNSGTGGTLTITGAGSMVIGAGRELVVIANARSTTIDAPIIDNAAGPSMLTYCGGGTCTLSRANTYSGGTATDSGTLAISGSGTLGSGDVAVSGGTLWLGSGTSSVIGDTNTVSIADGANVSLAAGVNETVGTLRLGSALAASGTWGATGSGAEHIDDFHLAGEGTLTVLSTAGDPTRIPRFSGTLDFGEVATNATATQSVEVWNDGNQPLSVTNVWAPAGFSVTQQVFAVPAGASVALAVGFAPSGVIQYSGLLTLGCNATSGTVSLAVSGAGVAPVPPAGRRTIEGLNAVIAVAVPEGAGSLGVEDELVPGLAPVSISDGGAWDAVNRKVKWFFNEPGQVRDRALQYTVNGAGNVVTGSVNFGSGNRPITGDTVFEGVAGSGLLHPADDNGDWRIELQEVSASVTRWKSGQDDVRTPVVIRGITLYLQGEQYRYDPLVVPAAKRWTPLTSPSSLGAGVLPLLAASSQRGRVSEPQAGALRSAGTTTVTIAVTPGADTFAWGLEESVPGGVHVSAIDNGGTWDDSHRRIKWAFFDGAARLLSYSFEGQAGTNVAVTGSVSFDGAEDPVTGTGSLAVPLPFITWAQRRGLSGDTAALFSAMDAEHGQPNGLVYAFQASLRPGDLFLDIGWRDGVPFVETPQQDPCTTAFVDIRLSGKTNLADTLWPLVLVPASDQTGVSSNRYRWLPLSVPERAFYRLNAVLK